MKKIYVLLVAIFISSISFYHYGRTIWYPVVVKVQGKKTVSDVIESSGPQAREKLQPSFAAKGISYPPNDLALMAYKDTDILEVWAANEGQQYVLVKSYPILAASGEPGPKLREGDRQVPEGIYRITGFNPNSAYHLSMKLNYPNDFDLQKAQLEGRTEPGTNIFIHGKAASIGCLAMGDSAIEELFTLVHDTGRAKTTVVISPTNPSTNNLVVPDGAPDWTEQLYEQIESQYLTINSGGAK